VTEPQLSRQREAIATLRLLHFSSEPVILPTVWDAVSGLVFQQAGFPAIGTGSQGIAATYGLPDGQYIPLSDMVDAVRRIVESVPIPVSADIESGYGRNPDEVYANVDAFVEIGIAGCNFEDAMSGETAGLFPLSLQIERLRAVRAAAEERQMPIFINAVTDSYLTQMDPSEKLAVALERATAYVSAGADGVYAPGMTEREDIAAFVKAVSAPVNVLIRPGVPRFDELTLMGVKRVTFGSGLLRTTTKMLSDLAAVLVNGDLGPFVDNFWPNAPFTKLMDRSLRTRQAAE
jgi:2-methylisocitrate lyase-like PEP mutase family enzyme